MNDLLQTAVAHHQAGRLDQAKSIYQEILQAAPNQPDALNLLGLVNHQQGHSDAAIELIQRAVTIDPSNAGYHCNLALAYHALNRFDDAISGFQQAIARDPALGVAHSNLGHSYYRRGRLEEAGQSFRQAITLSPAQTDLYIHFANILGMLGLHREATTCYEKAVEVSGHKPAIYNMLLFSTLLSHSPSDALAAYRHYADRFEKPLSAFWPRHTNPRVASKRLRVGYVSPDLRDHAVAYFIEPILAQHQIRDQVDVYCYYNNASEDAVTTRLRTYVRHWTNCASLTDAQLAARILQDGIDILVDLAGHTDDNRLLTFARKPAPVQITYLGYITTTGLSAIDYRLTHLDADPLGNEIYNSERLYRLPRSLWTYRPAADCPPVNPMSPFSTRGFITFGSTNNFSKVSTSTLDAWAEILRRTPGSRLLMMGVPEEARPTVRRRFAERGILDSDRIELLGRLPIRTFRELHNDIDIALDPFPINGNTTTCEAFWMGVPIVALAGGGFHSRFGHSLLKHLDLEDLSARDLTNYIDIACNLARDNERLQNLRRSLRTRFENSILRNEAEVTKDLEEAYRAMWKTWCEQATADLRT